MGSQEWYVAWAEPATVALSCDHASRASFGFKVGETGVVQISLGQDARVEIETAAGVREWSGSDLPAGLLEGVVRLRPLAQAPAPAREPEADFDETVLTPPRVQEPRVSAPEPDFDETVLTPPAAAPALDATIPAYDALVTDANGARLLAVDGALYVGRAPAVPSERGARPGDLAFVASRTDHVSATHLELLDDDGLLLVRDLWSTNGTEVVPFTGDAYRLPPGEWLPVAVGTRLRLADDVSVEVADAASTSASATGLGDRAE